MRALLGLSVGGYWVIVLAIGAIGVLFHLANGNAAPTATYTGAAIYWSAMAFGVPLMVAGAIWIGVGNSSVRVPAAAMALLLLTTLFAFIAPIRSFLT